MAVPLEKAWSDMTAVLLVPDLEDRMGPVLTTVPFRRYGKSLVVIPVEMRPFPSVGVTAADIRPVDVASH